MHEPFRRRGHCAFPVAAARTWNHGRVLASQAEAIVDH